MSNEEYTTQDSQILEMMENKKSGTQKPLSPGGVHETLRPGGIKQLKQMAAEGQTHVTPAQAAKIMCGLDLPEDATEEEAADACYEAIDWTWLDKIIAIVKGMVPFVLVSLGCFWGIQSGNMTGVMGWPIIYFCTAAVAFIIGRYARK